ncbi:MAG TPA: MarR family transcriptional regulator [Acidimicrobiales bacterium]|nr:MarR family transcriptional regulator [Acidimicrobiales bacterium]
MTARQATVDDSQVAARLRYVLVRMTRTLRREGHSKLSPSQISALATLEEFGPVRISALATHESIDPSVATRVVASLETQGLTERHDDPEDKRACLIDLSDVGRRALDELWSERTIGLSSRLERLTPNERLVIESALPALEKMARDN